MSTSTVRTLTAAVLFVHAIGHIQGILAATGLIPLANWNVKSWLLDGILGENTTRIIALILWIICTLGFLATAFSFVGIGLPQDMWKTLAIIFAVPSLLGLFLFWNSFAMFFNKAGCLAVNGWILIGLAMVGWPSASMLSLK